jgi:hypothetical protein
MRVILALAALVLVMTGANDPAAAAGKQRTNINMVVAFDRSESIDTEERQAQIDSLAAALLDRRFLDSVNAGYHGKLGLSVMAWSSLAQVEVILPWIEIGSRGDAEEAIRRIRWHQSKDPDVRHGKQTDIALAIASGVDLLDRAPFFGSKQVINIISDGVDNIGRLPMVDRDMALDRGITINGLVQAQGSAVGIIKDYFRRQVIGGPSSFVQAAERGEAFTNAMLRKMMLEVAALNSLVRADGT